VLPLVAFCVTIVSLILVSVSWLIPPNRAQHLELTIYDKYIGPPYQSPISCICYEDPLTVVGVRYPVEISQWDTTTQVSLLVNCVPERMRQFYVDVRQIRLQLILSTLVCSGAFECPFQFVLPLISSLRSKTTHTGTDRRAYRLLLYPHTVFSAVVHPSPSKHPQIVTETCTAENKGVA
jgi:hypothetical protein